MACLFFVVLGLGYAIDGPLYPRGVQPADHTHAFDSYCNPFPFDSLNLAATSIEMLKKTVPLSLEALQAKGMIITGEHISAAKTNVGYVQTTATTNTDGFNDL